MRQSDATDVRATARRVVGRLRAEAARLRSCADAISSDRPHTARAVTDTAAHIELTARALEHLVTTSLETPPPLRRPHADTTGPAPASTVGWLAMLVVRGVEHHHPREALAEKLTHVSEGDRSLLRETIARIESLDVDAGVRRRAVDVVECALAD